MFALVKVQLAQATRLRSKRRPPYKGDCNFNRKHSGLRKLMRAMRRGTLDPEHQRDIRLAEGAGRDRRHKYMSKSALNRDMLIWMDAALAIAAL